MTLFNTSPSGTTASVVSSAGTILNRVPGWLVWLVGLLLVLSPLGIYGILPALGISAVANFLSVQKLMLLVGLLIGGSVYLYYYRYIIRRPQLLLLFITIFWPLVEFSSQLLLGVGINLHARPFVLMGVTFPSLMLVVQYRRALFFQLPWFRYYALFLGWLVLYMVFYNANAVDPRLAGGTSSAFSASSGMVQLNAYLNCFLAMAVAFICMNQLTAYKRVFDWLNQFVLWVSALQAIAVITGYPFGVLSMTLDGFMRSYGFLAQPNPYAHHMGILMIYLLGLICYYQDEQRNKRINQLLLFVSFGLNFVAFLLGLSKTAFVALGLSSALLLFLNMGIPSIRKHLPKIMIGLGVTLIIGLFGFEGITGKSFFTIIESRIEQTESMDWRTLIWESLLDDINLVTMWLGHGFTAANLVVFQTTYSDAKNATPLMMVHNAYIALLYDLGIMGYSMFVALGVMLMSSLKRLWNTVISRHKTPYSVVIALVVYYSIVCGFDEMAYMLDAAQLFWLTSALWFSIGQREKQEDEFHYQRRMDAAISSI
jgi:O-antigen ligase